MNRPARRRAPHRRPALAALAVAALTLSGCATTATTGPSPTRSGADLDGSITVFAAASLTATFTELAGRFESDHPGVTVTLSFAGSSALVTQLSEGASADVLATADVRTMAAAREDALVEADPVVFASNSLEIAVPPGNPAGIESFADLGAPGLRLVVCAPQVPCGAATQTLAAAAGVQLTPVSEESAVTDVLGKVASGEADAGVVYRTDVTAAGDRVEGIELDGPPDAVNAYPIAVLTGSDHPRTARAFLDLVTGPVGAQVLTAAGFGPP